VLVRVGDYKQDNISGQNENAIELAPVDDNYAALRQTLWLATDKAYKAALQQFTAKQARLKEFEQQDPPVDDFSKADAAQSIGAVRKIDVDVPALRKALESATALGRKESALQTFVGVAKCSAQNRYFVNSEGSVTRGGRSFCEMGINGSVQAADGMRLELSTEKVLGGPAELPTPEKLVASAKELITRLLALRDAPIVEEQYRGPVLFSADAATTIFAQLVGENVEGNRPRPGDTNRTTGEFANSYKSRVLPDFVNITDDPTQTTAAGRALIGSYQVDDEGVKAAVVPLVEKGILINYVMSRRPIRDFPASNGHGRATPVTSAEPHIANMFVKSTSPVSAEQLKAKFIESCKTRGAAYCYRVESLGRGAVPRLLYRVYMNDGHEELVRGAKIEELDTRALRSDLAALGDDPIVSNISGQVPYSVIAPSAFFGELEVKRSNARKDKLPDYPAPSLASN